MIPRDVRHAFHGIACSDVSQESYLQPHVSRALDIYILRAPELYFWDLSEGSTNHSGICIGKKLGTMISEKLGVVEQTLSSHWRE